MHKHSEGDIMEKNMKCLIFSDSHGSGNLMREALLMHRDADAVFFLGDGLREFDALASEYNDKMFIAVRGNCDFYSYFKGKEAEKCESIRLSGYKITATHGDLYGVKYGLCGAIKLASDIESDIILFGHTHEPLCECRMVGDKTVYFFNPGSLSAGSFGILAFDGAPKFSYGRVGKH